MADFPANSQRNDILKLKAKQPQKEASAEVSLAEKIKNICAEAEAYVDVHVDQLKASEDGKLLPRDWLKLDVQLKHGRCFCKCALALLDQEKK
jgi:hypothetical protein